MRPAFHGLEDHALLFPQDEEDAAFRQPVQEAQVHVGPVGQQHVAVLQALAQRVRPRRVVVRGVLHDGEVAQHGADVQAHARLGRGLLPAVPRPVDAVEREPGVVESMAKMSRFRRKMKPPCFAYCVKDGHIARRCANTAQ